MSETTARFDFHEIVDFDSFLLRDCTQRYPRETKKFMRKMGNDARTLMRKAIRDKTKKKTGNLRRNVDKTAVHIQDGNAVVVVTAKAPHSFIVDVGHDKWIHGVNTGEYVYGRHFSTKAVKDINELFYDKLNQFLDDYLRDFETW